MSGPQVDDANYRFFVSNCQGAEIAVVRQDDSLLGVGKPENSNIVDTSHSSSSYLRDVAANLAKQIGDRRMNVLVREEGESAKLQCGSSTFRTISFFRNRAA